MYVIIEMHPGKEIHLDLKAKLEPLDLDASLVQSIQQVAADTPDNRADLCWRQICQLLQPACPAPSVYRALWEGVFENWAVAELGPPPMWVPPENESSNLRNWMNDKGFDSYEAFHAWASDNREAYWTEGIDRLQIKFAQVPSKILDVSEGADKGRWLVGSSFNIADSCFQANPDDVAIVQGGADGSMERLTYAELNQQVDRIAASLVNYGLVPGDAVAVFMPMTDLSVAIYLGMVRAGISVVSIADSFAPPEIRNRLRISNAKAIFTYDCQTRAGRVLPLFDTVCQSTEIPAIVIASDESLMVELRPNDLSFADFLTDEDGFQSVLSGPDHIINILFSSGTTGDPKAIPWTQSTPIKCALDGYCHQDIHAGDVVCWPTNLGWMMGPWLIFATLLNRGTIALFADAPMSGEFGRFVQDAKVNMLGVVPTMVRAWGAFQRMESFDWSAIRAFSSTGESSQANDMFYLSSLAGMRPVIEYCGGTEIGGGYITSTVVQPNVPSAFSTIALGLDIEILDENDKPADSGELYLVPPSIGLSSSLLNRDHHETYYADVPASPNHAVIRRHGDHMTRLAGGYYVAGGRVDDTMNLGGIKTSSAELERVMNEIDGVKETAAVAVSEVGGPNSLAVFVVLDNGSDGKKLKMEMNKRIRSQLNPLFKVKSVHVVESMPRTASGKVMRRKLRDQLSKS